MNEFGNYVLNEIRDIYASIVESLFSKNYVPAYAGDVGALVDVSGMGDLEKGMFLFSRNQGGPDKKRNQEGWKRNQGSKGGTKVIKDKNGNLRVVKKDKKLGRGEKREHNQKYAPKHGGKPPIGHFY